MVHSVEGNCQLEPCQTFAGYLLHYLDHASGELLIPMCVNRREYHVYGGFARGLIASWRSYDASSCRVIGVVVDLLDLPMPIIHAFDVV